MKYLENKVEDIKIAYIGGGSRGWAWGLMSDLGMADDISGDVYLYDIDFDAAYANEIIGNKVKDAPGCKSAWNYKAVKTIGEALTGADFVIISILPGTFKEMQSDVHAPEKYGIYQSVGDTYGPGGTIRAMRTLPMYEEIAEAIKKYSPNAWVISYTNPMTLCIKTLYRVFPEIKAFGCCHEVFGTQWLLGESLKDILGIENPPRTDINVNVVGINHFTWITEAKYRDTDIMPVYAEFCDKHYDTGYLAYKDDNWMNNFFDTAHKVKMDLFHRFGYVAAAGDRHLAEFCPAKWYLETPECAKNWKFGLTPVSWRLEDLDSRLSRSKRLVSGEEEFKFSETGEDGVRQIRALLGLHKFVTNVNIPNYGQIPNLPIGAVVETNAVFSADSVKPVFAGNVPESIYPLVSKISGVQETVSEGIAQRNLDKIFAGFMQQVELPIDKARELFDEMVENTKEYLKDYGV